MNLNNKVIHNFDKVIAKYMKNVISLSLKFYCFDSVQVGSKTTIFGKMFEDKKVK